jgi:hypothetical protein
MTAISTKRYKQYALAFLMANIQLEEAADLLGYVATEDDVFQIQDELQFLLDNLDTKGESSLDDIEGSTEDTGHQRPGMDN